MRKFKFNAKPSAAGPNIVEVEVVDEPQPSWEDGADIALEYIENLVPASSPKLLAPDDKFVSSLLDTDSILLGKVESIIDGMKSQINSDTYDQTSLVHNMSAIGAWVCRTIPYSDGEVVAKLAEKQAAYGAGNILAFGYSGIHVRMSDKVARLRNMIDNDREFDWEPLEDAWFDLVGYAVIARMLTDGTFQLPLERDQTTLTDEEMKNQLWDAVQAQVNR